MSCATASARSPRALTDDPAAGRRRVCMLGFTSVDYTTIDMALGQIGAVSVPLQTSAAITQLQPIVAETEPSVIAASVEPAARRRRVGPDRPRSRRKLVVFDYHPEVDDQREAVKPPARGWRAPRWLSRPWPTSSNAGRRCRADPRRRAGRPADSGDPLALLIYTSGSTGAPKGAMYPRATSPSCGAGRAGHWFGPSASRRSL